MPDDGLLHTCILTYASDYNLIPTALRPHGVSWDRESTVVASIDHAMWFHRPARVMSGCCMRWTALRRRALAGLRGGSSTIGGKADREAPCAEGLSIAYTATHPPAPGDGTTSVIDARDHRAFTDPAHAMGT